MRKGDTCMSCTSGWYVVGMVGGGGGGRVGYDTRSRVYVCMCMRTMHSNALHR